MVRAFTPVEYRGFRSPYPVPPVASPFMRMKDRTLMGPPPWRDAWVTAYAPELDRVPYGCGDDGSYDLYDDDDLGEDDDDLGEDDDDLGEDDDDLYDDDDLGEDDTDDSLGAEPVELAKVRVRPFQRESRRFVAQKRRTEIVPAPAPAVPVAAPVQSIQQSGFTKGEVVAMVGVGLAMFGIGVFVGQHLPRT